MSDAVGPAPSEQGWGKLLLALTAFLFLPLSPPLRALLPVEETLLLLVPAIAACCMVGWWTGGRLILAIVWTGLAAYMLALPSAPGSFYHLVCGWSLLLAGGFGLICLLGTGRPFLPRAFGAIFLALSLVLVMSARGPLTPARARQAIQTELGRRNVETAEAMRRAVAAYPQAVKDFRRLPRCRRSRSRVSSWYPTRGRCFSPRSCCSNRFSHWLWPGRRTTDCRVLDLARRSGT